MQPEVFGDYTLLRRVATGGTSEIFLGRRHGMDGFARHVAVKRILPYLANDDAFVQMILDEARLAAHLHHGHIVQLHQVGVEKGQAYIAMEYLNGTDVGRLIKAARRRVPRVLIVHRDVARRTALISALLERVHVEPLVATDPAEAHARSLAGPVDLVVIDTRMVGPIRDPMLHAFQRAHPELRRVVLLGATDGRQHGVYGLSTDQVEPGPAAALVHRCLQPVVPLELAIQIVRDVCAGLDYAHGAVDYEGHPLGIVHRDVNPSNVLVSMDGTVKLVDFGIARATTSSRVEQGGDLIGTLAYMSPEQANGVEVGPASDQFAVGTLLYELVTGIHPYERENRFATLNAIRSEPLTSARVLLPGLPKALADVLDRVGAKDPSERYPSVRALLDQLEDFIGQEGLALSPKRLAGFFEVVFDPAERAEFDVSSTGYDVPRPGIPARALVATPMPTLPRTGHELAALRSGSGLAPPLPMLPSSATPPPPGALAAHRSAPPLSPPEPGALPPVVVPEVRPPAPAEAMAEIPPVVLPPGATPALVSGQGLATGSLGAHTPLPFAVGGAPPLVRSTPPDPPPDPPPSRSTPPDPAPPAPSRSLRRPSSRPAAVHGGSPTVEIRLHDPPLHDPIRADRTPVPPRQTGRRLELRERRRHLRRRRELIARVLLTLILVTLFAAAGWYWSWRSRAQAPFLQGSSGVGLERSTQHD